MTRDVLQRELGIEVTRLLATSGGPASRPIPSAIAASKGSHAYQVHTYPTKVPPAAVEPFILASTEPDGTVFDPFCGSGMTGVAAQNVGRRAIMSDLAPGAVHLAQNHTHPVPPQTLASAMVALSQSLTDAESSLYKTACPTCGRPAMLRHLVWTDVHMCERCGKSIRVWDQADETGGSSRKLLCSCGHIQSRSGVAVIKSEPAEKTVACDSCPTLQRGEADQRDLVRLLELSKEPLPSGIPSVPMGPDREMYRRSALHLHGITNVSDFWSNRSAIALALLWEYINHQAPMPVRDALRFAFTNTAWHATKMRRYNARGGQRPLTGTLYIPQLIAEGNVFEIFRHQVAQVSRFYGSHPALGPIDLPALARVSSATDLSWLPTESIDYVFTDPPFGANLFYGDCNIVWESWLGTVTDLEEEIVVNRSLPTSQGGKTMDDYERLLAESFSEIRRVLRPDARVSVVFHNSDDKVWAALLSATDTAGLAQTDVSLLNKVQRSMKGYKGRSGAEHVPFYDLVITFQSGTRVPQYHLNGVGGIALDAVTDHLKGLPQMENETTQRERNLDYLYSLAVSAIIRQGHEPTGLSLKAFEQLLRRSLTVDGTKYYAR